MGGGRDAVLRVTGILPSAHWARRQRRTKNESVRLRPMKMRIPFAILAGGKGLEPIGGNKPSPSRKPGVRAALKITPLLNEEGSGVGGFGGLLREIPYDVLSPGLV